MDGRLRVHDRAGSLTYGHVARRAGGLNVPQGLHERGVDLAAAVGDGQVLMTQTHGSFKSEFHHDRASIHSKFMMERRPPRHSLS